MPTRALQAVLALGVGYLIFLLVFAYYGDVRPSLHEPSPLAPPPVVAAGRGDNATARATTPDGCTDFYAATCDLSEPSMFARVAHANEATMHQLVRTSGTYQACLHTDDVSVPAPASDSLGAWLGAGAGLPLHVQVETALDRPQQVLVLRWNRHLYRAVQDVAAQLEGPHLDNALALFPPTIFAPSEPELDSFDAYTARYRPWPEAAARLPPAWQTALTEAFPEALGTTTAAAQVLVWLAPDVTPTALATVAEAWATGAPASLHEIQQAAWWMAADARGFVALEHFAARQEMRLPHDMAAYHALLAGDGRRERACHAFAEVVERPGLNQAFLAATGLDDGERTADVGDLVVEVVHAVAGLLHGAADHLDAATRDAAVRKLEAAAVYVLGPAPSAVQHAQRLNALPADDFGSRVAAWRAASHARAARQLATPHAAWRRHLGQHLAHTVRYATVNAWYQPGQNTITVPPGILQAPVYVAGADHRSERLAHVGMILAHELGHALDVHGRQFDEEGVLVRPAERGWWTERDAAGFEARMACLAEDYGHPCGRPDYGQHTIGEDTADQLGLRASFALLVTARDGDRSESERSRIFFEAYARLWCARTPSHTAECDQVRRDVHALPHHRVNKSLRQLASFAAAYECPPDAPMVNPTPCLVY